MADTAASCFSFFFCFKFRSFRLYEHFSLTTFSLMLMIVFYVCVRTSQFFFPPFFSGGCVVACFMGFFFAVSIFTSTIESCKKKKKKRKKNSCWLYGVQCCPLSRGTWMSKKKKSIGLPSNRGFV